MWYQGLFLFSVLVGLLSTANGKNYMLHTPIPVVVNTVGPFNNPSETYKFYSLPFCAPEGANEDNDETAKLGETLAGDRRKRNSLYDIRFKVDVQWREVCQLTMTQNTIKKFMDAINERYVFEMFVDDLSVRGFVGEQTNVVQAFGGETEHIHNETKSYLFTHLDFSLAYNGDNVIAVNLTTDPTQRVELVYGQDLDVEFSFSAHWHYTPVAYVDRYQFHQRSAIMEQSVEIHWLSIINSGVMVVLLTAFLGYILMRALRKDFAQYMEMDEEEAADAAEENSGWKLLHGDVFRFPAKTMLFSSMVGCGIQMFVLVVSILILSLIGMFYPGNRGAIYSAAVMLYACTAGISGYISTRTYMTLGGEHWASNAVLTACVFTVPFLAVFSVVNTTAVYHGSSSALPFATIMVIVLLWALVTFPLTIIGAMRARKVDEPYDAPTKTRQVPREIPPIPWYRHWTIHLFIAGFLPFSAIYIELHYIFAAVWGHHVYTLFGILSIAFVLLVTVASFITTALTYGQLVSQDYHWWWRSFLSGASTGVFMFAHSVFYYVYRSEMNGALQASFFFGYMFLVSYAFSLLLGAVSFLCTEKFVKYIYQSVKID